MLKRFFRAMLCSVVLIGEIHAQDVIVAREKKAEHPKRTPQPSEQHPSESTTPTPRKSRSHEKKSASSRLRREEMRAPGARGADGPKMQSISQAAKTREPDVESAPVPKPPAVESPRPVK